MDTSVLKNFAQESRRYLMDVVAKKIEYYLTSDNVDIRANKHFIEELKKEISNTSKDQVIEKIAYTWFNRFCALRYMDVKQYSLVGVLTPMSESHTQPEILMEAKSGHIKDELGNPSSRDHVIGLLSGKVSTNDPQSEAYKHLVLMACNYYHSIMPFLFEKIDDYTELLMPDDLLSEASILFKVREALNEENCKDVEVIGWLYQFYISEKKDEVFEGLKKNKKISPENIPAATQLFTPNWIVRYLVENSLGRLWMLNRPNSNLISKMEYYIKPETGEKDFLKIKGPEEIKVCDPACGSGHMLVYAFDLLYLMYEEEGIDSNEIPSLIISKNLFGIEIDKRAGELAAFALTMKAREKHRRYFRNPVYPNIGVLENIHFEETEIKDYMDHVGHDLFSIPLRSTLNQFEDAKNFGSLIRPEVGDVANILSLLDQKNVSGHLFLAQTHSKVLRVLFQVKLLSPIYHVVIANPPYMGGKGMNGLLTSWAKGNYPNTKADLYAMFIERLLQLVQSSGYLGLMTPFTWMFLSTYETLRKRILQDNTILSLIKPEYHSFFESAYVPVCTFVLTNKNHQGYKGAYIDLEKFYGADVQPVKAREAIKNTSCGWFYSITAEDLNKIPGAPIAFWLNDKLRNAFVMGLPLSDVAPPKQGLKTGNNDKFLRLWHEVGHKNTYLNHQPNGHHLLSYRWFPCSKGGAFRKWAGNYEYVLDWENDGERIKNFRDAEGNQLSRPQNIQYFFIGGITWSTITVSSLSMRILPQGFVFESTGSICPIENLSTRNKLLAFLNSSVINSIIGAISPTLNYGEGSIGKLPIVEGVKVENSFVERMIEVAKDDWDAYEVSFEFKSNPLVSLDLNNEKLKLKVNQLYLRSMELTNNLQKMEIENNQVFIDAYGLTNDLSPRVELKDITLTCNPHYRFGGNKSESELEALFVTNTVKELISYSVGCMFGRFSLDRKGIILANKGESIADYLKEVPNPTYLPDEDNVIPILEGDWFTDDIAERFRKFLQVTFGEEHLVENLKFIEEAIGKDIRKYFSKDFYNDHVKMYKKRPIYWMFSSPKGAFNALIYMHRYTPDTVSIVLNSYLREFRTKLNSKRENLERLSVAESTSARDKTVALKEIEQLKKMIVELDEYEKDILYPLATQRLEVDLDEGVKANYPKLGKALKPIKGLDKDED